MKICQENPELFKIGQKYREFHMTTSVYFIVVGHINSP